MALHSVDVKDIFEARVSDRPSYLGYPSITKFICPPPNWIIFSLLRIANENIVNCLAISVDRHSGIGFRPSSLVQWPELIPPCKKDTKFELGCSTFLDSYLFRHLTD